MNVIDIGPLQLVYCLVFILIASAGSLVLKLGLERELVIGTIRTFAQLGIMGYVLKFIFDLDNVWLILLLFSFMVFWAAHAIRGRVKEQAVQIFIPTFISMVLSYTLVSIIVTSVIVQVKPWYTPQYFIPLSGMIIGNSMNAITIALDRLFSDIRKQRDQVELALCLGATYQEATMSIFRDTIRAGMIPSINALMTVGLVSIPGMMTGQILAGSNPVIAIKYQIIVMLMLVASTAIGSMIVITVMRKRCFTKAHQLML
ncbi:MAG: iron export ABC transporter permease subunit FetB [Gemmatimonadetes bacterium]|nr:iron export ABC transporter permease subunit FetB [Gemmatimonadota bacterium]HCK09551.1 iron export ABC transporter permease subunit FetB [Candidatus Latescibacterota bacterium]